ncbi:GDSL-type esterase/lipase family protein [Wielerella bovis]|uniref:GDSL-type esterase/lipase family protein n=1 Tax=Wielerella bovis TaxID=2917790 RepID=UPI00201915B2|nr:GDSL-type esterase/lipase family protein [Wielerella bovis]ULJ68309.1 GDSL-type esterase/lipase family protein [Wielerella bovis]
MNRRQFLVLSAALLASACYKGSKRNSKLARDSTVLCLGDSLTAGYGAAKGEDYPTQLADITGWKVINGGVSGDTSEQALGRLPPLMAQEPKLVIVSIGGNDFLQRQPESSTRVNIGKILDIIQSANIPVVLVAIPYFTTGALIGRVSEHPLYDDIAAQHRIPLLKGAWADILGDKKLKSDTVHANATGYRQFAEELADFLADEGFR